MIYGCKYWNDKTKFFTQENNAIETLLKVLKHSHYLETCGPSSLANSVASLGIGTDLVSGVQVEDIITCFLNNPFNQQILETYRVDLEFGLFPPNRVPQYYPYVSKKLFNVEGEFSYGNRGKVIEALKGGCAVQLCYRSPGHFVAAVAYDDEKDVIITKDSYAKTKKDDTGGFLRTIDAKEYANIHNYMIIYKPCLK